MGSDTKLHRQYYAHTVEGVADTSQWEPLAVHLEDVARLADEFASAFGAGEWGRVVGLWHDVGKYSNAFQDYLLTENGLEAHIEQRRGRVDHSTAGAQHAVQVIPDWGKLLAFVIAGHHAGLANAFGSQSCLQERLKKPVEPIPGAPAELLKSTTTFDRPALSYNKDDPHAAGFQLAFFTRMLFSCLVDADFLATEKFMSPDRAAQRPTSPVSFTAMQTALHDQFDEFAATAKPGLVTQCRQEVLQACRDAAPRPAGVFSLTVPTGGGKTLSSLAFAVDHALHHDKQRIIYAIPFTSIIEQTADVFRQVFGSLSDDIVLEHHSNIDPDSENETRRSRLAAENWDAPLVVTTNVQLFESLFAAKTSRCRKLHNLAGSVIILDEAQTLPVDRLRPCLAVLDELARNYGCTIVLCTATQPAVLHRDDFTIGLRGVHEIIPQPQQLYRDMRRVEVQQLGKLSDDELVDRFLDHDSFLAIVNTRAHAAKLYRDLRARTGDDDGLFHLSTLMCGQHRADAIAEIRRRLKVNQPCRVISTQLIEAGVDVDFASVDPDRRTAVFRAMTGIDSIAQAAGRCNREGRMTSGTVYVFDPADVKLIGYLASVAQTAREIAPDFDDLLDPAAVHRYFELHYWKQAGENEWDKTKAEGVMKCFPFGNDLPFNFRSAAERFRMIEETGRTVFVPYGRTGQRLIDELFDRGPDRQLLRRLQRYTVTLYEYLFQLMKPDIEELHGQYPVLLNAGNYDAKLGLRIDRPGFMEPASSIF